VALAYLASPVVIDGGAGVDGVEPAPSLFLCTACTWCDSWFNDAGIVWRLQYLTIPYGVIRFAISALRVTPYGLTGYALPRLFFAV